MNNLKVKLPGMDLDNPIIPASGTFGYGYEFADFYDINILGSISIKGTTAEEKYGNPLPRIADCTGGMLNSIGLQNPGVKAVVEKELVELNKVYSKKIIANIGGATFDEYLSNCKEISKSDKVGAIELNISCPNVDHGGIALGTNPDLAYEITKLIKENTDLPLYVKLSPNVTDIVSIAKAVEKGGADAISLTNTLLGMRIDLKTRKPILARKMGGFSGPAIKPVSLRMVYQVYSAVNIPVIGMGGVKDAYDVIEFMYAGATAVQVGSHNLVDPLVCKKIIEDLPRVMKELNIKNLSDIIGSAHE